MFKKIISQIKKLLNDDESGNVIVKGNNNGVVVNTTTEVKTYSNNGDVVIKGNNSGVIINTFKNNNVDLSGVLETKEFDISDRNFNKIKIEGIFEVDLNISEENENKLIVTTDKNLMEYIDVSTKRNLTLRMLDCNFGTVNDKVGIKIQVQLKSIKQIAIEGLSKVKGKVNVGMLDLELSGASLCVLFGVVDEFLDVKISGNSKLKAGSLTSNYVNVVASGNSEVLVNAKEACNGNASGISKIFVSGTKNINIKESGLSSARFKS